MKIQLTLILLLVFLYAAPVRSQILEVPVKKDSICDAINLTVTSDPKDTRRMVLKWRSPVVGVDNFFTIERSPNSKDFEVIGVIKGKASSSTLEYTDELPSKDKNYYRVRAVGQEGQFIFSNISSNGNQADFFCKFYPNPVNKLLIVRSESPVELKITDAINKVRMNKQLNPGLQLVDVSILEKGDYIITIMQQQSKRVFSDKLIRN